MKNLHSDSQPEPEVLENATTRAAERSQKIGIVFEGDDSARSVKIPIKNGYYSAKAFMPEFTNYFKLAYLLPNPRHEA